MGRIHVAVGPMFSGKTEWLIEKLELEKSRGKNVLPIRYSLDTRYSDTEIVSHNNRKMKAVGAQTSDDILKLFKDHTNTEVLGVDEMQFYDPKLADVLKVVRDQDVIVYVSGLDMDFKTDPWETTDAILEIADSLDILTATCSTCSKNNAIYTQRLIKTTDQVVIGGTDIYTARCEEHYQNL